MLSLENKTSAVLCVLLWTMACASPQPAPEELQKGTTEETPTEETPGTPPETTLGSPEKGNPPPKPSRLDCGDVQPWDADGDGLSDAVEANNAAEGFHDFRSDRCEDDPSRAEGTWYDGSLRGGINLNDRGTGFVHNTGTDAIDSDDWGTLRMIACLEAVGRDFEDTGLRVNVNDLSLRGGTHFPPHRSHQNGLDVDLRYVRKDGRDAPLDLRYHPEAYDAAATQELMRLFVTHCPVEVIFADLERLGFGRVASRGQQPVLRQASGHSNHFHVRLEAGS